MSIEQTVKESVLAALPGAEIVVEDMSGTGDKLQVIVKSSLFKDLSLIEQHKLVQDSVREMLDDGRIHALSIKTIKSE